MLFFPLCFDPVTGSFQFLEMVIICPPSKYAILTMFSFVLGSGVDSHY